MKKFFLYALAATAMLSTASCVSEDLDETLQAAKRSGRGFIALNVSNDDALTTRAVQDVPSTWGVELGGQATVTTTVGDLSTRSLAAGDYTVKVYNYATEADALAANSNYGDAYYSGDLGITDASKKVTVSAGNTTSATLALGRAKNAKFTLEATVPESAAITLTATGASSSRALTFTKAANGSFDHTTAFFEAVEVVSIGITYNGVTLAVPKSLTMAGAATENKAIITTNGNGKISLTLTYDDEFTTGNNQTITFDAATGAEITN